MLLPESKGKLKKEKEKEKNLIILKISYDIANISKSNSAHTLWIRFSCFITGPMYLKSCLLLERKPFVYSLHARFFYFYHYYSYVSETRTSYACWES